MKNLSLILCTLLFILLFAHCDRRKITRTDTTTSGVGQIVADECFAPIIQEQIDVFDASNDGESLMIPTYTSESEAFTLFMQDSVQLIVAARDITDNEIEIIKARRQTPRSQKFATDAIALIVNKQNQDTLITVSDIKKIMTGKIRSWKELNPESKLGDIAVAFDSPNSSTVRFIRDSICRDEPLGSHLKARAEDTTKTQDFSKRTPNQMVIDYVAANPNALGVIGVNWISNPSDSLNLSFINTIKVMSVSAASQATLSNSYKPYAGYLALKDYPLSRDIYIIITDVKGGLPSGFVNFAIGQRGQLIVKKAGLLPAYARTRLVQVNSSLSD